MWFGLVVTIFCRINNINQRQARLVLGWAMVMGKLSRKVISHPSQLSLAILPWIGAMSTRKNCDINRGTPRDGLAAVSG